MSSSERWVGSPIHDSPRQEDKDGSSVINDAEVAIKVLDAVTSGTALAADIVVAEARGNFRSLVICYPVSAAAETIPEVPAEELAMVETLARLPARYRNAGVIATRRATEDDLRDANRFFTDSGTSNFAIDAPFEVAVHPPQSAVELRAA